MSKQLSYAVVAGVVVAQLGWIDPLFVPLVIVAPIVTGAVAASRGMRLVPIAVGWAAVGITMLVEDWVINHEDRLFHLVLTVIMVGLVSAAWWVTSLVAGRRRADATA